MEKTGDFYIGGGGYLGKYRNFVSFVHITVNVDLWFHPSYLGGMGCLSGGNLTLLGPPHYCLYWNCISWCVML
jgi:hypothetical protein